jgi:hypothetical protein
MASSSHTNNDMSLPTLLTWYKIRDTFFGENFVDQNIPLALEMAADCDHPDAHWVVEVCEGKDVKTFQDAKRAFSAIGQDDARALCFAWLCSEEKEQEDISSLRDSAKLGFAFSHALMADFTGWEETFQFAQLAVAQGERDGYYNLGCCFRDGEGCERDLDKAKEAFLVSSKLGEVASMVQLGRLLDESDPQRWLWWGRAACLENAWDLLDSFAKQVELFNSGSASAVVVFAIGRSLHGHVNEESRTIFKEQDRFDSRIGPAKQAITFYEMQIKATKDAMHTWSLIGLHFGVVKDIRKLIAKLIWDSREDALFKK